jgi:hypothetical protein
MCDFNVHGFMKDMNLTNKHPEIFQSGKDNLIKEFLNYFTNYTKFMNSGKNISVDKLIQKIKTDFTTQSGVIDQLQINSWNDVYFKYCVKKRDNDVYVFPPNVGGEKLKIQHKYFVNCIKMENIKSDTLKIVNRNNHMMISGESKNIKMELGKELQFKILIIYNKELKKWVVVPYKMVSKPNDDVRCDSFALSATTDHVQRQYKVWGQGIDRYRGNLGVLNIKYLDEKYKSMPNLFGNQSDDLLTRAQILLLNVSNDKKKSTKKIKKKIKKKSAKKIKKKSTKKIKKKSTKKIKKLIKK